MTKRSIFSYALACGGLIFFAAGCSTSPKTAAQPITPPAQIVSPTTTTTVDAPSSTSTTGIVFKTETVEKKSTYAETKVSYPQLQSGFDPSVMEAFNLAVASSVHLVLDEYEQAVADLSKDAPDTESYPWSYRLDVIPIYDSATLINAVGSGSEYTGGAHPNAIYANTLFDVASQKTIPVADLFIDPKAALTFLSEKSIEKLKTQNEIMQFSEEEWIGRGAGEDWLNFQFSHFSSEGFVIEFPPYQVAAYAAGPQSVTCSMDEIRPLLKERYR